MEFDHFYLSVPSADGVFNGTKYSEEYEEGISYYEFAYLNDNQDEAAFELAKEAMVWVEDIDKFIKPAACAIENPPKRKADCIKEIKTTEKGKVRRLPSGNWKVEEPTRIRCVFGAKATVPPPAAVQPDTADPWESIGGYINIFEAAKNGTIDDLTLLVEGIGANVNEADSDGWTPLHHAAVSNPNPEVLEYLISQGANINAKCDLNKTPLDVVKGKEKKNILEYHIQSGTASDINSHLQHGKAYIKGDDPDSAILAFNEALEVAPDNAALYYLRGVAYGRKKEFDTAIVDFNAAIEINPEDAKLYIARGIAYDKKNVYGKAIENYETAIQLSEPMSRTANAAAEKLKTATEAASAALTPPPQQKTNTPQPRPAPFLTLSSINAKIVTGAIAACVIAAIVFFAVRGMSGEEDTGTKWYTGNPEANEFTISTSEELEGLARIVNGTLKKKPHRDTFAGKTITLAADIDLSQYTNWVPVGNHSLDSNSVFSGTFNGDNYVISGLTVTRPDTDRQGLFGRIDGGKIQNLGLDGVNIQGHGRTGALAGIISNGSITNIWSKGKVSGIDMVGGLAGGIANGSVAGSYSSATVSGNAAVGGVAGGVTKKTAISACYFTGAVSGLHGVGGVAGSVHDNSSITGSYSTGTVNGGNEAGGVAGQVIVNSRMANCYSTSAVSGRGTVGGVTGTIGDNSSVTASYSSGAVIGTDDLVGGVTGKIHENSALSASYASGTVTGGNSAGGVAGWVDTTGGVNNCAAMNPEVKGAGVNTGRVAGSGAGTLTNNAAYSGILDKDGSSRRWAHKGASAADGADITAAEIAHDGTIGGRFTNINRWITQSGMLPGLGKALPMPAHLTPPGIPAPARPAVYGGENGT
ncbi:MAG: ankyrin repeat domain-containing protein [Chitinispirillia bacterium]|nr:ankyrin repeat domain-containing protein [Chitinispirillia bacterium]MCL2240948.1 ankyrin repeat domain-containing protein [Chitinispirillia bacterium]